MSYIIGFGHRRRQGKDEAIKTIIQAYGGMYDIRRYHPADYMKRKVCGKEMALCLEYGVPYETNADMTDPLCNSEHGKQIALLQYMAEKEREEDPFRPVHHLAAEIERDNPQFALVSGVRYENEVAWIRGQGGIYVEVKRTNYTPSEDFIHNHSSETRLDNFAADAQITASSLEELRISALSLFDYVLSLQSLPDSSYFRDIARTT